MSFTGFPPLAPAPEVLHRPSAWRRRQCLQPSPAPKSFCRRSETDRCTLDGLRYATSNKGDAFTLSFGQIETFSVDYLDKNLRVKQRGGKTWNFTNQDADVLFVFHRDVEAARKKLAAGYSPAQ